MNPKYIGGVIALIAIGYGALWSSIGTDTKRDLVTRLETMRDQGMKVQYSSPKLRGFPYRMEVSVEDLSVEAPKQGWAFSADALTLTGHVWKPELWFITTTTANVNLLNGALIVNATSLTASAKTDDTQTLQLGIDLAAATFKGRLTQNKTLKGTVAELHLRLPSDLTGATEGLMEETRFKGFIKLANFGVEGRSVRGLTHGELDFTWHGVGPTKWSTTDLSNWRDRGGTLEVERLSLKFGDDELMADMSISLDEELRPMGAGSLKLVGSPLAHLKAVDILEYAPDKPARETSLAAQFGRLSIDGEVVVAELPRIKP